MTTFAIYFICIVVGFYVTEILTVISKGSVNFLIGDSIIWVAVGVCAAYLITQGI